jgi:hypothetical protein
MVREHLYRIALCVVSIGIVTQAHADNAEKTWNGVPFAAMEYEFEKVQPKRVAVNKLFISSQGMRAESIKNPQSGIVNVMTILNFTSERIWLADNIMKSYVLLEGGKELKGKTGGGLLSTKVCDNYLSAKKLGKALVGGRNTEKWSCTAKHKKDSAIQYFDPKLRTVIREEVRGHVSELRKIKPGKQDASLFAPPPGYRKYTLQEMMLGYEKLPEYKGKKAEKAD